MSPQRPAASRDQLVRSATELFRRNGYTATTVDQICEAAALTKGAFFHHFASKEEIAKACLECWDQMVATMEQSAPFQSEEEPLARLAGYMDFFIGKLADPAMLKSCLAGTTLQEVSETHPQLRIAADACIVHARDRLSALLDAACARSGKQLDTRGLANLWVTTMQGALLVCKGSRDELVLVTSLTHVKRYILGLLEPN